MIFKNKKIQKLISCLIIISVFAPSVFVLSTPRKAEAVDFIGGAANIIKAVLGYIGNVLSSSSAVSNATVAGKTIKDIALLVLQEVLKAIAQKALQAITKSTVAWINGGFHGSPLFLENPQSFFTDIVKTEIKTLVDQFGYDTLRFPYGKDFALNTINSYKSTLENNMQYTVSRAISDPVQLNNYRNNFSVGGWNGFLINNSYPQNNYIGFQMEATDYLSKKVSGVIETTAKTVQKTLAEGQGFLSPQVCDTNPSYNNMINEFQKPAFNSDKFIDKWRKSNPEPYPADDQNPTPEEIQRYSEWEKNFNTSIEKSYDAFNNPEGPNVCPKRKDGSSGLVNTTPGFVVGSQITKALGANQDSTTLAGQAGNALSTILGAVIDHFLDQGLNSLASTVNSKPSDSGDGWTYAGQTLDSGNGDTDPFSGPDREIILKDFRISLDGKTIRTFEEGEQLLDEKGLPRTYTNADPIVCVYGDKTIDTFTGEILQNCVSGEIIICKLGEQIDYKAKLPNKACTGAEEQKQYHANGDRALAEGGEIITFVGDLVDKVKSSANPENTIYYPGDINLTIKEIGLIDNPCDPNDTDCLENPLNPIYNPGIKQLTTPVEKATQELDQCVPGPDKGWEFRMEEEKNRVSEEIQAESGGENSDKLKKKRGADTVKELKFAVNAFKDWIEIEMMKEIPGELFYIDAVKEIDNFYQQSKELIDSRQAKVRALARISSIKNALDKIYSKLQALPKPLIQPEPGSAEEREMIALRKQYEAVRPSISSFVSVENSQNELNILKEQYTKLTNDAVACSISSIKTENACTTAGGDWGPVGLIARCMKERTDAGWGAPEKNGKGGAEQNNTGITEIFKFCGSTPTGGPFTGPIASGYSHGDISRNDQAAREMNCFPTPETCNSADWDTTGWFIFRNPNVDRTITTPNGPVEPQPSDEGDEGYKNLPIVNAMNIMGDDRRIDGTIDCRTIFKARDTDYTNAGDINSY